MNLPNCRICIVGVLTVSSLGASPQDTRLLDAAKSPNRTQVNALLSKQVDPNVPQADGATALHWAAYWNDDGGINRGIGPAFRHDRPSLRLWGTLPQQPREILSLAYFCP